MTAPLVFVVDAGVAAQLVSPEPLTAQATALFALLTGAQDTFHIPELFYIECANIFWKKKQRGVCSESQAVQALVDYSRQDAPTSDATLAYAKQSR